MCGPIALRGGGWLFYCVNKRIITKKKREEEGEKFKSKGIEWKGEKIEFGEKIKEVHGFSGDGSATLS